jgi:hypothetical protein
MRIRYRDSCRKHFRKLKILPLQSQYILSLLLFVIHNKNYFKPNSKIHSISTGTKSNLHQPLSHLTTYQIGTRYYGIKVFISLPTQIEDLSYNIKLFKMTSKSYLYSHSFYTLEE